MMDDRWEDAILKIESVADYIQAEINGQPAGTRVWRPWELNITSCLVKGKNRIVIKITNSRSNFIESKQKLSGLLGEVTIEY